MTSFQVIAPTTEKQWDAYYDLRWRVLREPWQQPRGSERDEREAQAIHRAVLYDKQIVGVGRWHAVDAYTGQIRYMAVAEAYRRQGIASLILQALEAASQGNLITLNSRESACGFYQKHAYTLGSEVHTLYGEIRHFEMHKERHG